MDPNRDSKNCCTHESRQSYLDFHSLIQTYYINGFLLNRTRRFQQSLLIDIHGQVFRFILKSIEFYFIVYILIKAHPENRIEIGYLLTASQLNTSPLSNSNKSSINNLFASGISSLEGLVRGTNSFGDFLNKKNLAAVPSPATPQPLNGSYYNGGFISQFYSSSPFNLNCIQSELPYSYRVNFTTTAKQFASALFDYYNTYFSK
jgi:hypothetical protein